MNLAYSFYIEKFVGTNASYAIILKHRNWNALQNNHITEAERLLYGLDKKGILSHRN